MNHFDDMSAPVPNADVKILVVDDVAQNIAAIEAVLAQPGLQILKARSGTQALDLLLIEEVALALMDVRMPNMDGFELAELMRGAERTRSIPIIFMTAASHDPVRTFRGYEAGAVDFLHKPLDPHVLKSKVEVFIELYSQRRRISTQVEELRAALRLNEMFTAVLGHDLRSPLNAVSLGAEALLRHSSDAFVASIASRIQSSSQRMAKMIEQLLDLARLRAGVTLKMQPANVYDVCRTIRDELESAPGADRIVLTCDGDTAATVDVDRLSQVFSNLVGNALQHSDPGTPVSVNVNGAEPNTISVSIGNQGTIPPERMKSLFEPFGPGSAARRGLGLGLFIANQFVQAHGGTMRAHSSADAQTVFELSLPRTPARGRESGIKLAV